MKKITLITVLILLILISGIGIASAETIAGNLSSPEGWTSANYGAGQSYDDMNAGDKIQWVNIQNSEGAKSWVHFDLAGQVSSYAAGAPNGWQEPFNWTIGTHVLTTGTFGFQRLYNSAWPIPAEIAGYQYWMFDTWNITGLSGNVVIVNNMANTYTWVDYKMQLNGYPTDAPSSYGYWYRSGLGNVPVTTGNYTFNKEIAFKNSYNATKPSGIGITGHVIKHETGGTIIYNSRAYIVDGTFPYTPLTSQSVVTADDFFFNVQAGSIKICLLSSAGNWYNTSKLFGVTPPGNLTGTHNITFHVMTYQGVNIYNAKVVFASKPVVGKTIEEVAVSGYTNASGMITFTNQPAGAAAIVQVTATGYKDYVATFSFTSDMLKEIQMSPPSVDLYVNVRDSSTGHYMEDFQVGIQNTTSGTWRNSTQETGSLYFDSTGANYEYPLSLNETVILAASKAGYKPNWKSVTIPYDMYTTTLYLINLNATAPSSGNFTAVIAVSDRKTGTGIQGASVTIQGLGRAGTTTTAGAVTFRNVAAGTYTLSVSAPGYQSRISDLTGTDGDTVLKSIQLLPEGCSISESGTMICDGSIVVPGMTPTTNQTANEKAAGGVNAFLDNIVSIGSLILIAIVFWFGKKIIFS